VNPASLPYRLFEMGFGEQLREILGRLPDHRQTVLFSATLPKERQIQIVKKNPLTILSV
jgi:superfamily II DNA/RNA helicase